MNVPYGSDWQALQPLLPVFLSYVLSFVFIGIYWNNHHHMLHTVQRVTGSVLWANLYLPARIALTTPPPVSAARLRPAETVVDVPEPFQVDQAYRKLVTATVRAAHILRHPLEKQRAIEVRPVQRGQERLREAAKLGFTQAIIPKANVSTQKIAGIEIIAVERVEEAVNRMR